MERQYARDLYFLHQDASVDADWDELSEANEGADYGDGYRYWEHTVDPNARRLKNVVFDSYQDAFIRVTSKGETVEEYDHDMDQPGVEKPDGPMMNFYWPLGDSPRHDPVTMAWLVRDFNVCIVQVGDEYGIALTGGGMDLSWDLAAAAVAVGYAPWRQLRLSQGSPESTWDYGIHEVGRKWAKRVRNALRHRIRAEQFQLARQADEMKAWK
jgi:hypothetical protein